MAEVPVVSLPESFKNDDAIEFVATIADIGLDAAIQTGALDGVPIVGAATGLWRAQRAIRDQLYLKKIARFLAGIASASAMDRNTFVERLRRDGEMNHFGEAILLLLDKADEMSKPEIIGRVMAAHVSGKLELEKAMRLAAIIGRCYISDLNYLRNYRVGFQREMTPIAESLFAAGLLSAAGIDGGTASEDGENLYEINEFGQLLMKFGWAH